MDKNKPLYWVVLIIAILTFLEITFYFVYIFKPFDRITGRDIGVLRGVPTASELFTPMLLGQYISKADESKNFYSERLDGFKEELKNVMSSKSSFVKTIEANYTVAGTVQNIKIVKDINSFLPVGYDITIKNYTGGEYVEHIKPSEASGVGVSLVTLSSINYSREDKDLDDIKIDDYLVIKKNTNLLNPSEKNISIEILRTVE